jgi:GT2 family glycosyltransferase/ubiquinone/menaquinone biosynthesis C-methylase UbiE
MAFTGERFIPEVEDEQMKVEHIQRYLAIKNLVKNKTILDAATGDGYGAAILSESAEKVIAIDISETAISIAKNKYKNDNLVFQVASISEIPIQDNSIDFVVSFETIEHVDVEIQTRFINEVKRVLKDDGILIISTPNKKKYSDDYNYKNPFHVKEFYLDEFKNFLSKHFEDMVIYHQKNEVVSLLERESNDSFLPNITSQLEPTIIEGKYLIAVCGKKIPLGLTLGSVFVFDDKFKSSIDRIHVLQKEVEDRNIHIRLLDKQIEEYRKRILDCEINHKTLNTRVLYLENEVSDKTAHISMLDEQIEGNQKILSLYKHEVLEMSENQNSHISEITKLTQQLSENNKQITIFKKYQLELQKIHQSKGWRILVKYYGLRDELFPKNSIRRAFVKLLLTFTSNPKMILQSINKHNFTKLRYYLRTEKLKNIGFRVSSYMNRYEGVSRTSINLFKARSNKVVLKSSQTPKVSIIIPVYNQFEYTMDCLASIERNTNNVEYEVIIADDNSTDETINIMNYVENLQVIRDGANRGFLLNCNNAAKYANGQYIFFLNNDTNVQENWLSCLVELIERDTSIGMVGSRLVYPDGRLQEAGGIIWSDASGWNYGRLDDPGKPEYNYVKEVDYISGAAIMIRSNLWHQIGGFDLRYVPAYFEDTDLAFEVRKHGYKVVLQPKSVIVHFEGISHGIDLNSGIKAFQIENKIKFYEKWKSVLEKENFKNGENVFSARERSSKKETLLVIDHYVPHYDKDAGSRQIYNYLKLLSSMGYNVKFIGDNFYRHEPYTSELENYGIEILCGTYYQTYYEQWIKDNGHLINYVLLNRPHISIKYIDLLKKHTTAKIVYYVHDLHFVREMSRYNLEGNKHFLQQSKKWKTIEFDLFSKSDVILTLSTKEKEIILSNFRDKEVITFPIFFYEEFHKRYQVKQREHLLFVGGFNHSPNVDAVKWFVAEVFPLVKQINKSIKLLVVGSNPPEEIVKLETLDVRVKGFVSDEELEELYQSVKLIVIPLRFGAGVKGKTVEAMYHQIPIVTTEFGIEGLEGIENVIKSTNSAGEFANQISELYNNERELMKLGEKYDEYVRKNFSKEYAEKIMRKIFAK